MRKFGLYIAGIIGLYNFLQNIKLRSDGGRQGSGWRVWREGGG